MEHRVVTAVGVWFYAVNTKRYLYLLRNDKKYAGTWGLPGGKVEKNETLLEALVRECHEELSCWPEPIKLAPIEQFVSDDQRFIYHTFLSVIDQEFLPVLNHEHVGYAWVNSDQIPKSMHPGLWITSNIDAVQAKIKTLTDLISRSA